VTSVEVEEGSENPYFSHTQHRVLSVLTWTLFLLGMLAWFVEGANRPLDPGFAPAVVMLKLCVLPFG
jgi:hypothetical protein